MAAFLPADLPSPLKALAGIALTMAHDAKHLPERAVQLPGSVLTHLAAKSLKVQQQYAHWVARGEEFLGSLQEPSEEVPPWATFDEDLPAPETVTEEDVRTSLGLGPGSAFDLQADDDLPVARRRTARAGDSVSPATNDREDAADASAATPAKKATPAKRTGAKKAAAAKKTSPATKAAGATKSTAAKKAAGAKKPAGARKPTAGTPGAGARVGKVDSARHSETASTGPDKVDPAAEPAPHSDTATTRPDKREPAPHSDTTSPPGAGTSTPAGTEPREALQSLPDFDTLTIPQLRTRLKTLRTPELSELIEYEESGRNRAAVVGMLRARLDTLQK